MPSLLKEPHSQGIPAGLGVLREVPVSHQGRAEPSDASAAEDRASQRAGCASVFVLPAEGVQYLERPLQRPVCRNPQVLSDPSTHPKLTGGRSRLTRARPSDNGGHGTRRLPYPSNAPIPDALKLIQERTTPPYSNSFHNIKHRLIEAPGQTQKNDSVGPVRRAPYIPPDRIPAADMGHVPSGTHALTPWMLSKFSVSCQWPAVWALPHDREEAPGTLQPGNAKGPGGGVLLPSPGPLPLVGRLTPPASPLSGPRTGL